PPRAGSFAHAAQAYRQEESFVDQARMRIWESDILESSLRQAYTRLSEVVGIEREQRNRDFGELLASWSRTGSHDRSLLGVEEVHDRIVVPLARQRPVLLAVIDGMSVPVFRELQNDLIERGWVELVQREDGVRPPVIAALPSLTEVSRTSLLCGTLVTGQQNIERAGFAKHPGLVDCSEPSKPPVLFHKGELRISGAVGLAPNVREEIADPRRRVVGVVINAVDDHLAKGEQVRVDWTAHRIRPLKELLQAAAEAERAVVIVSDHGHVLEHHTESRVQGESDRWREDDGKPAEDEVVLQGPRVLLGAGGRLIAPWSERVRFGSKKNGYHGGVSPQEIVIPLAVFLPTGLGVEGWHEAPPELPDWWEAPLAAAGAPPVAPVATPVVVRPAPPKSGETGRLFPTEEEEARAAAGRATTSADAAAAGGGSPVDGTHAGTEWIDALLASDRLATQRSKSARIHLPDERLREILSALDERGGKLTRAALAKKLGVAPLRVGGIVSALRRVLNVEGYDVLSVDEASDTIELNRSLLETQFGLGEDAP
ncbi:MAG: BREX-2 system phosphatase PglZ, partial [bacterium]